REFQDQGMVGNHDFQEGQAFDLGTSGTSDQATEIPDLSAIDGANVSDFSSGGDFAATADAASDLISTSDGGAASTLFDPSRPSLPYECSGATITQNDLLRLFDAASSMVDFSDSSFNTAVHRATFGMMFHRRQCTGLTGCGAWTASMPIYPYDYYF